MELTKETIKSDLELKKEINGDDGKEDLMSKKEFNELCGRYISYSKINELENIIHNNIKLHNLLLYNKLYDNKEEIEYLDDIIEKNRDNLTDMYLDNVNNSIKKLSNENIIIIKLLIENDKSMNKDIYNRFVEIINKSKRLVESEEKLNFIKIDLETYIENELDILTEKVLSSIYHKNKKLIDVANKLTDMMDSGVSKEIISNTVSEDKLIALMNNIDKWKGDLYDNINNRLIFNYIKDDVVELNEIRNEVIEELEYDEFIFDIKNVIDKSKKYVNKKSKKYILYYLVLVLESIGIFLSINSKFFLETFKINELTDEKLFVTRLIINILCGLFIIIQLIIYTYKTFSNNR